MRYDDQTAQARAWLDGWRAARRVVIDALAAAEEDLLKSFLSREAVASNGKREHHGDETQHQSV